MAARRNGGGQAQGGRGGARRGSNSSGHGSGAVLWFLLGAACVGGGGYLYLQLHQGRVQPLRHAATSEQTPEYTPGEPRHAPGPARSASGRAAAPAEQGASGGQAAHTASPLATSPPFGASEDVFEAGAHIYRAQCASCHGVPGHDTAEQGRGATQYFASGADPARTAHPSQSYRAIALGVPMTAMPAYRGKLSDTQMWQLALLLQASGAELPQPVSDILAGKRR
jgi:mono/diheme cytochrome c family protein